jgi:hypothetical protein
MTAGVLAQVDERIPPSAEKLEAQRLAAKLFNDYRKSRDLSPLIPKFFINDFVVRLTSCRTTGDCGGTNRDFWEKDEGLTALGGTPADHMRSYVLFINFFHFSHEALDHMASRAGRKLSEYEQGEEEVKKMLQSHLIDRPDLRKTWETIIGDEPPIKFTTLKEYRQHQNDLGLIVKALDRLEAKLRAERIRKHPRSIPPFRPQDFTVYRELNRGKFFGFESSKWMYQVWSHGLDVPFIVDMIREKGKFKIVAVYPPID